MLALAGVDPSILVEVAQLTDAQMLEEAHRYTGLTWVEFGEDVLMMPHWEVADVRWRRYKLKPLLRRYLATEIAKMRQRQVSGVLPDQAWCPSCGRGDQTNAVARVVYVVPPSVESLFWLDDRD